MNEQIILVNENDEEIGSDEKISVHRSGTLHRAFSIFIFDLQSEQVLLQKRAIHKYHSGGLWTNACCSHPHINEDMDQCLMSRLHHELGITLDFRISEPTDELLLAGNPDIIFHAGSFIYRAPFGELTEHEIDHVYVYSPCSSAKRLHFHVNPDEAEELKWISLDSLKMWMRDNLEEFTVWFPKAFEIADILFTRQRTVIKGFSL